MSEELTVLFRQSVHHLFNAARQFSILSFLPFIAPLVFIFLLTGCGEKDTHKSCAAAARSLRGYPDVILFAGRCANRRNTCPR
jgi:hypothetical protein